MYITILLLMSFLIGCGSQNPSEESQPIQELPFYSRKATHVSLAEDYNPYMLEYSENGLFYYSRHERALDDSDEYISETSLYYQNYTGEMAEAPFVVFTDSIVKDMKTIKRDGNTHLLVLWLDTQAHISEYDEQGNLLKTVVIDDYFNDTTCFPILGGQFAEQYLIGLENSIFLLSEDGTINKNVTLPGTFRDCLTDSNNTIYILTEEMEDQKTKVFISSLDLTGGKIDKLREVPGNGNNCFLMADNRFMTLSDEYLYVYDLDEANDTPIIDLRKQSILASQVQYACGTAENLYLVSVDELDPSQGIYLFAFSQSDAIPEENGNSQEDLYAEDGRRIVRIAVPSEYPIEIEFHVTRYNQISNVAYVEVNRFEDSLETYLGKGARPDIIMMNDLTDVSRYTEKNLLCNLVPLFDSSEDYSLSDILPKAREILGDGDNMYAFSGRFRLLLRISDGTEFDNNGNCSTTDYLMWYSNYLNDLEITGIGKAELLLYAAISSFYNENTREASFTSGEFKALMQAYKELLSTHRGKVEQSPYDIGFTVEGIAKGPMWYTMLANLWYLTAPGSMLEGLPAPDGSSRIIASVDYPLGILSTSEYPEGAFDFIMYFSSLNEHLYRGYGAEGYGKYATATAPLSTFVDVLQKEIYETELPFCALKGNTAGSIDFFYFTDEHKNKLTELIENSVIDTEARQVIYGFLLEEMAGYLNGSKSLDECCVILQNRVQLYLDE